MQPSRRRAVLAALAVAAFAALGLASAGPSIARSSDQPVAHDTPAVVAQGKAQNRGHHNGNELFRLNVGLTVRNSSGLDALIKAASTPGSPQYGHYLTNAQYMSSYAPTDADVQSASAWLKSQGLDVTGVTPDNLLIHVQAKVNAIEKAFNVSINDYSANGRSFHSNDRDPTVPAGLNVNWISGMSNYDVFKPAVTCVTPPSTGCSLDGTDLKNVYDVVGDGAGQTLGFTLWGEPLPQSDFTSYATATGTTALTIGQAGNDGLDFITVDGTTTESDTDAEVALDTQNAHLVAPKIHETYWQGSDNSFSTLEDVLNAAANSTISVISNSWGAQSNPCSVDSNMESSLQHGAATGKTFYFSSGDAGASGGCSYPAVSQYVVAVGGTALNTNPPGTYVSESAVNNGGGCLDSEPRPSWQTGIGTAQTWGSPPTNCTGRAEPDVAAITGFCTDGSNCGPGTFIFFGGTGHCCFGGTSLAAPVWAASTVVWNNHNAANGRPGVGFDAPLIYALANDPTTYARDFHDVTTGTNGFAATAGWDEATGWGSPDVNKLANNPIDITYTGPTSAQKGDTITLSATLLDKGASTTLATAALGPLKVSLAAAGSNCDATVDASGHASCTVTVNDDPGGYKAIAAYAGDAAYVGGSQTKDFTVLHIPTKITYSGDTSGDYNDPVTFTATLVDDGSPTSFTKGNPLPGEQLTFTLGAEHCSATTDASGKATCQVTPLDNPGPYSVVVSFGGDEPTYEASMTSAAFTLNKEESKLVYSGAVTADYHDTFTAKATLTDPDGGAPIAGKTVTFTLGVGDTCSGVTDASGVASCTFAPTQTGTKTLAASFAGDIDYISSSDSTSFTITPEETTMAYTGPKVILAGSGGATLTAKLVEDGANDNDSDGGSAVPSPQEPVTLSLGSQSCTGTTSASTGIVTCTIPSVTVPLGPQTVGAAFAGDAFYQKSSDSTTAIVFAFPSRGAFTLGNTTVTNATPSTVVTWWGDTWPNLNTLTGGVAPSADKGFAGTITLPTTTPPTTCGSAWTTGGGNSPPPTSGVPSYMGVVVTSSVTKNGNNINGNSIHIVVVKVAPGYTPTPSTHGTGTIVATFC
jgi:hypothetical protein